MKICPVCNQGLINKARIKETDIIIYICDECDTVWNNKDLPDDDGDDFEEIMKPLGRKGLWSEITDIERL